ncbi:hypothetical protein HYY74_02215 [Candidatus Woesearchaeota archaeon]|nr:hypothetical protein [Candidatus Woesearchaeota archaeon]
MGRKPGSRIRQNIVEILYQIKQGYGYEIYKIYRKAFPKASMRSIYYHLRKGTQTKEFKVQAVEKSRGEYSWGGEAEKTIYALGENAAPRGDEKLSGIIK